MKAISFTRRSLIGGLVITAMALLPALTDTAQAKHDNSKHNNGKHKGWDKGKHKGWSKSNTSWRRTSWPRTSRRYKTSQRAKPYTPSVNARLRLRDTDYYRTLSQARVATAASRRNGYYTTSYWSPSSRRYVVRQYVRR